MKAEIYWIPGVQVGRLAILPRPRGGDWLEDEIVSLRNAGVDYLGSLLTPEEVLELELAEEAKLCATNRIVFLSFPVPDRGVPSSAIEARKFAWQIAALVKEGKGIAIHCRQGVGRSALLAVCVLVALEEHVDSAFLRIAESRGCTVPDTSEQREWVERLVANDFSPENGSD